VPSPLSLKATDRVTIHTNEVVKIPIGGRTLHHPPVGRNVLALYANVALPKQGTPERTAVCRGGWRAWFQRPDASEADHRDETGYLGPVGIPTHGNRGLLISHAWPHGVTSAGYEFCFEVFAYNSAGHEVRIPLVLTTREAKGDPL
jgi:hypothetical protein